MTYFQDFALLPRFTHRRFDLPKIDFAGEDYLPFKIIAVFFTLIGALAIIIILAAPGMNPSQIKTNTPLDRAFERDLCHNDKLPMFDMPRDGFPDALSHICGR